MKRKEADGEGIPEAGEGVGAKDGEVVVLIEALLPLNAKCVFLNLVIDSRFIFPGSDYINVAFNGPYFPDGSYMEKYKGETAALSSGFLPQTGVLGVTPSRR